MRLKGSASMASSKRSRSDRTPRSARMASWRMKKRNCIPDELLGIRSEEQPLITELVFWIETLLSCHLLNLRDPGDSNQGIADDQVVVEQRQRQTWHKGMNPD